MSGIEARLQFPKGKQKKTVKFNPLIVEGVEVGELDFFEIEQATFFDKYYLGVAPVGEDHCMYILFPKDKVKK